MIEWWLWIVIIGGGLLLFCIGMIVVCSIVILMLIVLNKLLDWYIDLKFAKELWKGRNKARKERLAEEMFLGVNLPRGKAGTIRLDRYTVEGLTTVDLERLENRLKQRCLDLGVDSQSEFDVPTQTFVFTWSSRNSTRPGVYK